MIDTWNVAAFFIKKIECGILQQCKKSSPNSHAKLVVVDFKYR